VNLRCYLTSTDCYTSQCISNNDDLVMEFGMDTKRIIDPAGTLPCWLRPVKSIRSHSHKITAIRAGLHFFIILDKTP
jgi:hypothetical protein